MVSAACQPDRSVGIALEVPEVPEEDSYASDRSMSESSDRRRSVIVADWDTPVNIEPLEELMKEHRRPQNFLWQSYEEPDEEEPWWMAGSNEQPEPKKEPKTDSKGRRRKKVKWWLASWRPSHTDA